MTNSENAAFAFDFQFTLEFVFIDEANAENVLIIFCSIFPIDLDVHPMNCAPNLTWKLKKEMTNRETIAHKQQTA